jgi:hypothetical protein
MSFQSQLACLGAISIAGLVCSTHAHAQCTQPWTLFDVESLVDVGFNWDPDGAGPGEALYVFGGGISIVGGSLMQGIAAYNPATGLFSAFGNGLGYEVDALTATAGNDLVAAGGIGIGFGSIDLWNGSNWINLGSTNGYVWSLATMPNGDIIASGFFTQVNGISANRIAKWNGSTWSPLGTGLSDRALSLAVSPSGNLIAAGDFVSAGGQLTNGGIAEWDGVAWSSLVQGNAVIPFAIVTIEVQNDGSIIAVGAFIDPTTSFAHRVARWRSTGWEAIGTGPNGPTVALTVHPNGDIFVGGYFQLADGVPANNVARWDGTSWAGVFLGLGVGAPHQVISLTTLPSGAIMAGGAFDTIPFVLPGGGIHPPTNNLAILDTTCAANTISYGNGCSGAGGPNVLFSTNSAWIGGEARATAAGVAIGSVAVAVWGFAQASLPPDYIAPSIAVAPAVATSLPIPDNTALIGVSIHHQVAVFELDAGGALDNMTSTNGLTFVVGDI